MSDWNFQINLQGVSPALGSVPVPEGYYMAELVDAKPNTASTGREQIELSLVIKGGDSDGSRRTTWLNVPTSAEDACRYYWRGLLESLGYTAAQIDSGVVNMKRELIVGKTAHFYYKPGDRSANVRDVVQFLPVGEWTTRKASFVPSAPAATGGGAQGGMGSGKATGGLGGAGANTGNNASASAVGGLGGSGVSNDLLKLVGQGTATA